MKRITRRGVYKVIRAGLFIITLFAITSIFTGNDKAYGETNGTTLNQLQRTDVTATSYKLNKTSITIAKGTSYKIKVTGTTKEATWKSKNKSIATVSASGTVKAKKKGTTYITAKIGRKTIKCKVKVIDPKISKTYVSLIKGQSYKLKITGGTKKITWKSSNKSIATISSSGTIKAKKKGDITISAKVAGKTLICKLTVIDPKISKTSTRLIKGKTASLKVTGTKRTVKWKSSNTKVATVSSKGYVVAKKKGTAEITAKIKGKSFKCVVTVETPKITKSSTKLGKGSSYTLKVTGTKQKITWKSSNIAIATVSSKGVVKAVSTGSTKITAKVGGKSYSCTVTVYTPVPASISKSSVTLTRFKTYQLSMKNTSSKATWSSSDKTVATVSSTGVVKAITAGTTVITATIGTKEYTCKVTVKEIKSYLDFAKFLVDSINAERVKRGLPSLEYVTSGAYYNYIRLYSIDETTKAVNLMTGIDASAVPRSSMVINGLPDEYNRNRIIKEHPKFYEEDQKYISVHIIKGLDDDYNLVYFGLFNN